MANQEIETIYTAIIELEEGPEIIIRKSSLKELFKALLYWEIQEDFWCIRCILKEGYNKKRKQVEQWAQVDVPKDLMEALSNNETSF